MSMQLSECVATRLGQIATHAALRNSSLNLAHVMLLILAGRLNQRQRALGKAVLMEEGPSVTPRQCDRDSMLEHVDASIG